MNIQTKAIKLITAQLRAIHYPSTPAELKCIGKIARAAWRLHQLTKVERRLGKACPVLIRNCRPKFEANYAALLNKLKQMRADLPLAA